MTSSTRAELQECENGDEHGASANNGIRVHPVQSSDGTSGRSISYHFIIHRPFVQFTPRMEASGIEFRDYQDESQLEHVMKLVTTDLSEPYSIFTYRYFLHRFPELCILAVPKDGGEPIGCVVGKIDQDEQLMTGETRHVETGYIGMLAVKSSHRRQGVGKALVRQVLQRMKNLGCKSVTLETEVSNTSAQKLYQDYFGFVREELLVRYYLNFNDAYRLRLWFEEEEEKET